MKTILPSSLFAGSPAGLAELAKLITEATRTAACSRRAVGPLPCGSPGEVLRSATEGLGFEALPEEGMGNVAALSRVAQVLADYGVDLSHPQAAAHLQPPPLTIAVAADVLASASNASLDTYDSGPSAIAIERWLIRVLVGLAGLGPHADGVLTPGGSMSNLLALLLARDEVAARHGIDSRRESIRRLPTPVVFCSELAHFSIQRACGALGLGEAAVRPIATDARRRIRPASLACALRELGPEHTPLAIVATLGTTDFGSMDPLVELSEIAGEFGVWLHADAAYGFGALFSERLKERLAGLERTDSITLDLHKLGWQPAAASVLLVSKSSAFRALSREVAYLNPLDDQEAGLGGLLGLSLQTTRRPDAVKVAATLLALGRRGLGNLVDACHDLACHAQQRIQREPELELVSPAELTTVVFRYKGQRNSGERLDLDELNAALRRRLLESGNALLGRTAVRLSPAESTSRVCLKLTLLNPAATPRDIDDMLQAVLQTGRSIHLQERAA
jgi:L-2,4-diaminobutyrate decarboxylase